MARATSPNIGLRPATTRMSGAVREDCALSSHVRDAAAIRPTIRKHWHENRDGHCASWREERRGEERRGEERRGVKQAVKDLHLELRISDMSHCA